MIKKIKIVNHSDAAVRDTTIGNIYNVNFCEEGSTDIAGDTCLYDTICLIDDVGDRVAFWTHDDVYEVVDED